MSLYRPVKIGSLQLPGNLFLAPLAGYTERAFRSICTEQGANLGFTELISAEALYRNPAHYGLGNQTDAEAAVPAAINLISRGENEKHYGIQLFAGNPQAIYKAALLLAPLKPDVLDINSCCPVTKVVKNGAGAALMREPAILGKVVEAAVQASRERLGGIPVTIKILSGWDFGAINYAECARIAVEAGAAMVSLHPRTRSQMYEGKSNWAYIADLVTRISVPVAGSGDLYTPQDAQRMLKETSCAAIMFARGCMGNPFIFSAARSQLTEGKWEAASFPARIAIAMRHLEQLAVYIGERSACLEMRKQFCAYTKGLTGGAALREKLVHAATIAEYQRIIGGFNPA